MEHIINTLVNFSEVDETRAYYTEWNKSEREKEILYINAYIWNVERWYWWTYLQCSSAYADIESRLMGMVEREGEEDGVYGECNIET